jgi:hypothetical protein
MFRVLPRAVTFAALAMFAPAALAADDNAPACDKEKKALGSHLSLHKDKPPQPTCDSKIYPLSDWHYIKKFCCPQVCPNVCNGYFPNTWRSWETACGAPLGPTQVPEIKFGSVPPIVLPGQVPAPAGPMPPPVNPDGTADKPGGSGIEPPKTIDKQDPVSTPPMVIEPPKFTSPPKAEPPKADPPKAADPPKKKDQSPITVTFVPEAGTTVVPPPAADAPGILLFPKAPKQ